MLVALHYLHVLFAFVWFAAAFSAHWNMRQARRAQEWSVRETLFAVNRGLSTLVGLPPLVGAGLIGNWFAVQIGYRTTATPLMVVANSLGPPLWAVTLAWESP